MRIRAVAVLTALVTVATLVVGVSGAEAKGSSKAAPCSGPKSAAINQIKTAYDYFLNGTTQPPRTAALRESYIQGMSDPALAALYVKGFTANAAQAATTNVKVSAVTCDKSKKKAAVKADLVISGAVLPGVFPNPGGAVIEGNVWKVSKQTFCDLIALADSTVTQAGQPCAP